MNGNHYWYDGDNTNSIEALLTEAHGEHYYYIQIRALSTTVE